MSVNKTILLGNLGDDPQMHNFTSGGCVASFSLATNETYKNSNGEKVSETQWHNVKAYNKLGEIIEKYFKKGDQIYLEGKLNYRKWEDKNGVSRTSTEIRMTEFSFVGSNQ